MTRRVQLSIGDAAYATALREALSRSGPWQVERVARPALDQPSVVILDEAAFAQLPLPLDNPERLVLLARPNPQFLAEAWEAGIVSVVSFEDPLPTVLLAIMAAALRITTCHPASASSGISPSAITVGARISSETRVSRSKNLKLH